MTNSNATENMTHTSPTHTDFTNNSSPISNPTGSTLSGNAEHALRNDSNQDFNSANSATTIADLMAQPLPPAQDAGHTPSASPDLHTSPPTVPLPPTSNTGTAFNTPDAGTDLPDDNINAGVGNPGPMTTTTPTNAPLPNIGSIDRDALAGENKGAGSQADAEAISSTGPI